MVLPSIPEFNEETKYKDYKFWLSRNGCKPSTIYRHVNALKLFAKNKVGLNFEEIEGFIYRLKEEGKKAAYLNTLINTAARWGRFNGDIELTKIRRFKKEAFMKATMSDDEIIAFLSCPPPTGGAKMKVHWHRWTVFFSICAYTGMRMGEVANLTRQNVDLGRGLFTIEDTKTHQPRMVPIPDNITKLLNKYMQNLTGEFLFPSPKGGHTKVGKNGEVFDSADWHYNFKRRIRMLGIERTNLTPYSLRHSLISRLLEEDVNLYKVMKLVGHSDVKTTLGYTHLTTKDIVNALKKHPLVRRHTDPKTILRAMVELIESFSLDSDQRFNFKLTQSTKKLELSLEIMED